MAKVNGLFVIVAGTASLCTAYVMHSGTATHLRIEAKQTDIAKDPSSRPDTARVVAPEGMQAYLRRPTTPAETVEDQAASAVVTIVKRNNAPIISTSAAAARWTTPVPGDRTSLVGELQRELRRVGCYDGALNESWTLATRTAMKTFTNRINAILPIDKPDRILLTLVQGYRDRVCGVACPPGEGLAKDGRCLPNVVLALATKKAPQISATSAAEQPRDLVTSVWSTVTPAHPGIRDPADDPMLSTDPTAEHANVPRVGAAAQAVRVRPQRAYQRRTSFARSFFGLFGW
jgi:hypothetical protein